MNSNGVSSRGFQKFIEMSLGDVKREERLEKLRELAFKTIREPDLPGKDEMLHAILDMLKAAHFQHDRSRSEDDQIAFLSLHKELFDLALKEEGEALSKTKEALALQIFFFWSPDPALCDYSSAARILPLPAEAFLTMIHVYDQSDEKLRKKLDKEFRDSLFQANWERTSEWILTPGLTEGLGNHLAKHRTRIGGFEMAVRDVMNSQLLVRGIDHLSPQALAALGNAYENICHLDDELKNLRGKLTESFVTIGYKSKIELKWLPNGIWIVADIHIPTGKVDLANFNSLSDFVKEELAARSADWARSIAGKVNGPLALSIEVFEQEDLIGKITVS